MKKRLLVTMLTALMVLPMLGGNTITAFAATRAELEAQFEAINADREAKFQSGELSIEDYNSYREAEQREIGRQIVVETLVEQGRPRESAEAVANEMYGLITAEERDAIIGRVEGFYNPETGQAEKTGETSDTATQQNTQSQPAVNESASSTSAASQSATTSNVNTSTNSNTNTNATNSTSNNKDTEISDVEEQTDMTEEKTENTESKEETTDSDAKKDASPEEPEDKTVIDTVASFFTESIPEFFAGIAEFFVNLF